MLFSAASSVHHTSFFSSFSSFLSFHSESLVERRSTQSKSIKNEWSDVLLLSALLKSFDHTHSRPDIEIESVFCSLLGRNFFPPITLRSLRELLMDLKLTSSVSRRVSRTNRSQFAAASTLKRLTGEQLKEINAQWEAEKSAPFKVLADEVHKRSDTL